MTRVETFELEAQRMREQEIARLANVTVHHVGVAASQVGHQVGHSLHWVSEAIRPLFSWVPAHRR